MADILLCTLNARYIHASFGLRYLMANLGPTLQNRAEILEFDIQRRPHEIVETLLARKPTIVGFGVYIWNVLPTQQVVSILKKVAPNITVVLGGPEVSYECEQQAIVGLADYVITGEADLAFAKLCEEILSAAAPREKIVKAALPNPENLTLPYDLYSEEDIKNRVIYVEASRGCPFTCEFCLSSLEIPVRAFTLEPFLAELEKLLARGTRQFKFVDRTFNLNIRTSKAILEFFLQRYEPNLFVHFEMIPDRLPSALRDTIVQFPPSALQFEVGIQSFNPEVCERIRRRQNFDMLRENLKFLRQSTGVYIHADLIVGLPGEDEESFAKGFDELVALNPQEIQVGILKRLRGTPIVRHDTEWEMLYATEPPYELLQNKNLSFSDMQRLGRFARYWDLIMNSGRLCSSARLLWSTGESPYATFAAFCEYLYRKIKQRHAIAPRILAQHLRDYLLTIRCLDVTIINNALHEDYIRSGAKELGNLLENAVVETEAVNIRRERLPRRQTRHLGN